MPEPCRDWRGELAAFALDRLSSGDAARVLAHCETCAPCRAELAELRAVGAAVALADLDHIEHEALPPSELRERVLAAVRSEQLTRVRGRRRVVLAVAAAAVVLALGAGATALALDRDKPPDERVAFDIKTGGAWGRFNLVDDVQGTRVNLYHGGLDPTMRYWLWLTDSSGKRTGAGSFWGTAEPNSIALHAAIGRGYVSRVWITDESDHVVLDKQLI